MFNLTELDFLLSFFSLAHKVKNPDMYVEYAHVFVQHVRQLEVVFRREKAQRETEDMERQEEMDRLRPGVERLNELQVMHSSSWLDELQVMHSSSWLNELQVMHSSSWLDELQVMHSSSWLNELQVRRLRRRRRRGYDA
jgi:hypothetical protein